MDSIANTRERISRKGWRKGKQSLIKLGEIEEHRSIRYGKLRDVLKENDYG